MKRNYHIFILFIIIFSFCLSNALAFEQSLSKLDRAEINKALQAQGVTEKELGFEKKWATDSFYRLKIVTDIMDEPLKMPDYLDKSVQLVDSLKDKIVPELVYLSKQLDIDISDNEVRDLSQAIAIEITKFGKAPDITDLIIASYKVADKYLKQSIKNLKQDEITTLLIEAPVLWSDEEDTLMGLKGALHREFGIEVDTSKKIELDTLLEIIKKIDRHALALSGLSIAIGADKILNEIAKLPTSSMTKMNAPGIKGSVYSYRETEWGKVVIGSEEDNVYEGDYALIVDIGGNDTYKGRTGAAVGILSNPFSVAIDLNGDDLYDAPKTLFNFGTGLFGCGILIDMKGDDTYKGFHNSLGAGLFGTGVLLDYEGNDIYSAGCFSEGAGNFGIGILTDIKGNDSYRAYEYCQAFSSTWGYGLLSDLEGCDLYYAGGEYKHTPLLKDDYRSMAQGFSIGFRPTASGGIALLYDKSGQDFYNAGAFAQGCSYWYSLGMLFDGEGNDFYNATEYAQGAGIHLSNGILVDRSGDDHYHSRLGPAQGEGHDFAVGILIDKKGNDSYMTSGGQGIGLTNSVGLFIDEEGNDVYAINEKNFGQGMANWSRGFLGIGIFLDLQGEDRYPRISIAENNESWTQEAYGLGIDIKGKEPPQDEEAKDLPPDTTNRPIEDVFKEASLWEVGTARAEVRRGRKELLERVSEAIPYIFKKKIDTKDGLELRAIEDLSVKLTDSVKPYLFKALHDPNRYTRSNTIYLLGKVKGKDVIDTLLIALKEKWNRSRWIISALGDIGDKSTIPIIIPYLFDKDVMRSATKRSEDEPARITAAVALGKLKDSTAIPSLIKALDDKFFTVRSAVENSLVQLTNSSLGYLLEQINLRFPKTQRAQNSIIRVLGSAGAKLSPAPISADTKTDSLTKSSVAKESGNQAGVDTLEKQKERAEIIKILTPYLDAKEASLRLNAVEALWKLKDESLISLLQSKMAVETDEFVITKYKNILEEQSK
jgi:HEAT repeat protein